MNESSPERTLVITKSMTVGDVAQKLGSPVGDVILYLLRQGIVCNKNKVLPENLIKELARHYGIEFELKIEERSIFSIFISIHVATIPVVLRTKGEQN